MGEGSKIWWGAIASERQAREIIAWAAWCLILIGTAPIAALSVAFAQGEIAIAAPYYANLGDNWYVIGEAAFVATVMGAAVLLLRTQSWLSALVLLTACIFVIVLLLATMARMADTAELSGGTLAQYAVLTACVLFFTHLVWRAMVAAQSLKLIRLAEHFT